MVRGKTQMRLIENATSRQVTFSKRRNGLMKKAFELSVLCDAEVALIIFSPRGKLYEFASSSMQGTIERYRKHAKAKEALDPPSVNNIVQLDFAGIHGLSVTRIKELEHLNHEEAASLMKNIEQLEVAKRKMLGEDLGSCSIDELQQLEHQLEKSVCKIRARKIEVFEEQIKQLRQKEKILQDENAKLLQKWESEGDGGVNNEGERGEKMLNYAESSSPSSEVETELFIGPPEAKPRRFLSLH
ncbi:MADS-box protein SOC1 isoform X1 [Benincasa hispida]|uniref:MADS-box protein SOC1 isoform X1 n=1 Tax=Benincasa hispida TaxID=102211 RepID=UPI0018FF13F5|nr:MADS-box protein SOC1 isoform X1 [Benincasa hispida]